MALCFELVVDSGPSREAAEDVVRRLAAVPQPLVIDGREIALHPPVIAPTRYETFSGYQVSFLPERVGYGVAFDAGRPRVPLTGQQLTRLGQQLYERLRGLPEYRTAAVGWDVEWAFWEELRAEYLQELADGSLAGLVVRNDLLRQLPTNPHFVPFDQSHSWIAYAGTRALT